MKYNTCIKLFCFESDKKIEFKIYSTNEKFIKAINEMTLMLDGLGQGIISTGFNCSKTDYVYQANISVVNDDVLNVLVVYLDNYDFGRD